MVDRLQEVPHPAGSAVAEGRVEVDVTDNLFLTDIPSNEDLPQPSPRERKKRVVIADPPTVQVQEIENEGDPSASFRQRLGSAGRAAKQGLYSVQRPRNMAGHGAGGGGGAVRSRSRSAGR